jgi:hypothetical protein
MSDFVMSYNYTVPKQAANTRCLLVRVEPGSIRRKQEVSNGRLKTNNLIKFLNRETRKARSHITDFPAPRVAANHRAVNLGTVHFITCYRT